LRVLEELSVVEAEEQVLAGSAVEAAALIRRGERSSRELTELVLKRVDAVNPGVNAVVEPRRERALREAAAADRAIARGEPLGPLHGVPITVKEAFHVAGLHTTWGNPAFKEFVAGQDATVVARLRQAGAIVVGTTNVAFMLGDFGQTTNELYGTTNNPWDQSRTPGGSSGGSAAALAAGMTFLEYGSDLVGSIRIPASFCGVYGLKPSAGIVPLTGFQPPTPGPPAPPSELTSLLAVGPLARSAGDLRVALAVTAGPEEPAAKAFAWALALPRQRRLADFRVGVVLDDLQVPVTTEIGAMLSDAVDALARAGAQVVEGWPEGIDPAHSAASFAFQVGLFFAFQSQQPEGPDGEEFAPLATVVEQEHRRIAARRAWSRYFETIDVFLCPANFTAAFPHDPRPFESAPSPPPTDSGPTATSRSGSPTPRLPACPPWSPRWA
jgi:amidase